MTVSFLQPADPMLAYQLNPSYRIPARVPRHVAFILDGNRRWAQKEGVDPSVGYQRGGERVRALLPLCEKAGIEFVTLWPLSIENLLREARDLAPLMAVITNVIGQLAAAQRWRVRLIGNLDALPAEAASVLASAAASTADVSGMTVNIAVAYEGRDEIVRAIRRMVVEHQRTDTLDSLKELGPDYFASYLDTAGQPDPDLIIRTSGEQRLSRFLSWQSATSEFYFCDTPWPAFDEVELDRALDAYGARERRFGR